jgi:predicted glycosyltransferase involved in capsule biosynthesis
MVRAGMFDRVSVLMAYQPDHGPRDTIFKWIKKYYAASMPKIELCIGMVSGRSFNKSRGLNLAALKATRDIFVIADGDVIYDPAVITDAVKLLKNYAWVIPFHNRKIINLSQSNTEKLIKTAPGWPLQISMNDIAIEKRGDNFAGKLIVISRGNFRKIGGFDERFIGYGWEDSAFQNATSTICGPFKRLDRKIYHLWHPRVHARGNPDWEKNRKLGMLYKAARGNMQAMQRLIHERR